MKLVILQSLTHTGATIFGPDLTIKLVMALFLGVKQFSTIIRPSVSQLQTDRVKGVTGFFSGTSSFLQGWVRIRSISTWISIRLNSTRICKLFFNSSRAWDQVTDSFNLRFLFHCFHAKYWQLLKGHCSQFLKINLVTFLYQVKITKNSNPGIFSCV